MPTFRSQKFRTRGHNRYWWYRYEDNDYVPPIFQSMSDEEWHLMDEWFHDTEVKYPSPGEISVPGISFLFGLIGGNGISRVVQCGHYVGYSTLLLGFLFRRMNKKKSLFSIDIDPVVTDYTRQWVERAGLSEYVELSVASSSDPATVHAANTYLGSSPQLVFIDSSHQYEHTLAELDLWWPALKPGGLIAMHDVSDFAQGFDPTNRGGVLSAVIEWGKQRQISPFLMNQFVEEGMDGNTLTYKDGCGIGLVQKPMTMAG